MELIGVILIGLLIYIVYRTYKIQLEKRIQARIAEALKEQAKNIRTSGISPKVKPTQKPQHDLTPVVAEPARPTELK